MRPIDADALKEVLERNFGHTGGAAVLTQLINNAHTLTLDDLREKGEWLDNGHSLSCTNCGYAACCNGNYCPNCGAKMGGGE